MNEVSKKELSYEETRALMKYLSTESYAMNKALRLNDKSDEMVNSWIDSFDSCLKKMSPYSGVGYRTVYFGDNVTDMGTYDNIFRHMINTGVAWISNQYLSFSDDPEYMDCNKDDNCIGFYIKNITKGKDLTEYNKDALCVYERESRFFVKGVTKHPTKGYDVYELAEA